MWAASSTALLGTAPRSCSLSIRSATDDGLLSNATPSNSVRRARAVCGLPARASFTTKGDATSAKCHTPPVARDLLTSCGKQVAGRTRRQIAEYGSIQVDRRQHTTGTGLQQEIEDTRTESAEKASALQPQIPILIFLWHGGLHQPPDARPHGLLQGVTLSQGQLHNPAADRRWGANPHAWLFP